MTGGLLSGALAPQSKTTSGKPALLWRAGWWVPFVSRGKIFEDSCGSRHQTLLAGVGRVCERQRRTYSNTTLVASCNGGYAPLRSTRPLVESWRHCVRNAAAKPTSQTVAGLVNSPTSQAVACGANSPTYRPQLVEEYHSHRPRLEGSCATSLKSGRQRRLSITRRRRRRSTITRYRQCKLSTPPRDT